MDCRYCRRFVEAKWRISADKDESKKKKPDLRHCPEVQKYIDGNRKTCEKFYPHHIFWCNKKDHFISVEACVSCYSKGTDEYCIRCFQYKTIVDVKRAIAFEKRKEERELADAPLVLIRRKTT